MANGKKEAVVKDKQQEEAKDQEQPQTSAIDLPEEAVDLLKSGVMMISHIQHQNEHTILWCHRAKELLAAAGK